MMLDRLSSRASPASEQLARRTDILGHKTARTFEVCACNRWHFTAERYQRVERGLGEPLGYHATDSWWVPHESANSQDHCIVVWISSAISVLLDGGVSIRAVAQYLGHADPGFTLRVYSHLMPDTEDRARAGIDAAHAPAEPERNEHGAGS